MIMNIHLSFRFQDIVECFCGNEVPPGEGVPCNFPCPGNSSQKCGNVDEDGNHVMAAVSTCELPDIQLRVMVHTI